MSKFKVELEVLTRHLAEAEETLLEEAKNDGSQEAPPFLQFRRALRDLRQSIDQLHDAKMPPSS
jgi:hypothetical protein